MYFVNETGSRRLLFSAAGLFLSMLVLTVSMTSCVGRPRPMTRDFSALVNEKGEIFITLTPSRDRVLARKMLGSLGLEQDSLQQLLDRTDTIHASFRTGESVLGFNILSTGRYPDFAAALSLKLSGDWSKIRDDHQWWEHRISGIQLAFIEEGILCISSGGMKDFLTKLVSGPAYPLPRAVREAMDSSSLTAYAEHPSLPGTTIPVFTTVQDFAISFSRAEGNAAGADTDIGRTTAEEQIVYLVDGHYRCGTEAYARSLYLLLRLSLLTELGKNPETRNYRSLMERDPLVLEKDTVRLEGYPVSFEKLEWFFSSAVPFAEKVLKP